VAVLILAGVLCGGWCHDIAKKAGRFEELDWPYILELGGESAFLLLFFFSLLGVKV
jgi:hypothetical protein